MREFEFRVHILRQPKLAALALDARPVWLFAANGSTVLFANPAASRILPPGLVSGAIRAQLSAIAGRMNPASAPRFERLRGLGAALSGPQTCQCARLAFSDGLIVLLVIAAEASTKPLSLDDMLGALTRDAQDDAQSLFAILPDGRLAAPHADNAGRYAKLTGPEFDRARHQALQHGQAEIVIDNMLLSLHRIGAGQHIALIGEWHPLAANTPEIPQLLREEAPPPKAAAEVQPDATPQILVPLAQDNAPQAASKTPPDNVQEQASAATGIEEAAETEIEAATEEPAEVTSRASPNTSDASLLSAPPASSGEGSASIPALPSSPMQWHSPEPRRHPLRFMWQMDEAGHFAIGSDEFTRLVGPQTAASFGRLWREINDAFKLDPDERIARALATRDTWSGIVVQWPFDGSRQRLDVEMSGLPVFDRARNFMGYRGFGVCRDLDGLNRLAGLRQHDPLKPAHEPPPIETPLRESGEASRRDDQPLRPDLSVPGLSEKNNIMNFDKPATGTSAIETAANVVPFRPAEARNAPAGETTPTLTPVENTTFAEIARQLSERLTGAGKDAAKIDDANIVEDEIAAKLDSHIDAPASRDQDRASGETKAANEAPRDDAPFGRAQLSRPLLELLPLGILVYRLDHLLFANRAFLERTGYPDLQALSEAGGLDALFVEPESNVDDKSGEGQPLRIATAEGDPSPVHARLYSVQWDNDTALALVFLPPAASQTVAPASTQAPVQDSPVAQQASELLDLVHDGALVLDKDHRIIGCNKAAEQMFGLEKAALTGQSLIDLLDPASAQIARGLLDAAHKPNVTRLHRVEASATSAHTNAIKVQTRGGGPINAALTATPASYDAHILNVVLQDLTHALKSEAETHAAQRESARAMAARNGLLARISHEIRAPLNAIIGFANVMIGGQFGPLGNERYAAYLKDIRTSGESVVSLIDNLLDLSHIETGKAEFRFTDVNLNDLVEHCVALMQPQANRERIIIRTSLAHNLPPVHADSRALRQIALNLIANSIKLSEPGGQVIVSTALGDLGETVLRVRDSGPAMSEKEIAAAMDPFAQYATSEEAQARQSGLSLPLTRALTEANKARFQIVSSRNSAGTLIEITFPQQHAHAI